MTRDCENARTDNREPHPFWNSQEGGKKPTGRVKKGADAPTTHDDNPQVELEKRKAP